MPRRSGRLTMTRTVDSQRPYNDTGGEVFLEQLDRELIGLRPVKTLHPRIAALLGGGAGAQSKVVCPPAPPNHAQCPSRQAGTEKRTVAERISEILHAAMRKAILVTATREHLVAHSTIGHNRPENGARFPQAGDGRRLVIRRAYYLYRPENENGIRAEAIEILLQVMENNRETIWW